jgi:DNA replication protein DnaD
MENFSFSFSFNYMVNIFGIPTTNLDSCIWDYNNIETKQLSKQITTKIKHFKTSIGFAPLSPYQLGMP